MKSNIFNNKKYWKSFSENELNDYAWDIFRYYKKTGFPYYKTDNKNRKKELDKFIKYTSNDLIVDNKVKQTMHGLNLAWSYMPHSFEIICNNMKTPLDIYNCNQSFYKAIHKRLKYGDCISDAGLRKILKTYSGVQTVSNFRPTAAYAIYERYAGDGNVLDMSSGFGGRLLGALKSKKVKHYIGLEPSTKTFNGLKNMINDLNISKAKVKKIGSEDYKKKYFFDLCFTSPPYFDTEKYSNESTQSYKKFNDITSWYKFFLKKTIDNSCVSLKKNGYLILNVKNTKQLPDFENKVHKFCNLNNLKYVETLQLSLSRQSFNKGNDIYNYEPIIVYKKC